MLASKFLKNLVTGRVDFAFGCLVEQLVKDAYSFRVIDNSSCPIELVVG